MLILSRFISRISHPVFTYPLALVLLFGSTSAWLDLLLVLALSFLLPFSFFLWLYLRKKISDFDVSKRKERVLVFAVSLAGMLGSLIYLAFKDANFLLLEYGHLTLLGVTLVLINFKIKVSIHVALVTVISFLLWSHYAFPEWIFLIILPVIASRLHLKRHTRTEVLLGFLVPCLFYLL